MDHIEMVSVFDEATRDHEAEQHTAAMTVAVGEVASVWPFLALAQTQEEYEHRLALSRDRVTSIAQRHGVSYEDLTAPLARGFAIALEARTATDWRNSKVDPAEYQKGSHPECPTCKGEDPECPECDGTNKQRWRRKEARLPGSAVKCGHCGHSNPGHSDGAPCACGCTTFQPSSARSATRKVAWTHDPQRDGSGCTSCGSYAQVDSDNLCRKCSDAEDEREAKQASKTGSWLGDEIPGDYGQGGNRDPNQYQDYTPEYKTDSWGTHEVMPPGSVQVSHRPDKSGRYDVRQVWDPMSAYIVHQGYDIDRAHAAANKAVDDAKTKGCEHARLYPIPGYQGPNKEASKRAAVEQDAHASGFGDTRSQTTPYGQHPYPEGESEAGGDPNQKVEGGWGSGMGTDVAKESSRDPYALIRQALADGQDPLLWIAEQNPPGGPQNALVPSGHDSTQQFAGTNPVALTQAMEQGGGSGSGDPSHHDSTQEVEHHAAEDEVSQGGTGAPEQPGGHRSTQASRLPKAHPR